MTDPSERDDVADLLSAYDAPPPGADFVEHLRANVVAELEAAQAARRRLIRLWRYAGAAAAAVLAVGIGWALFHNGEGTTRPTPGIENPPVAFGTPRRVPFTLPDAQFACTPRAVPVGPHIEPYSVRRDAPAVFVPATADNLALDMPVTSSDTWPLIGSVDKVTDGRKRGFDDDLVELGPGPQWVQIDLGQRAAVHAIVVWHYVAANLRVYHDVVIQVADDPALREGVTTVYNNDYDNSLGLGVGDAMEYVEDYRGRVIDVGGVPARYVRLWSRGNIDNDTNHYVEVEVYGEPEGAMEDPGPSVELRVETPEPHFCG